MSAREYCSNETYENSTMSTFLELCEVAQIRIVLQIIFLLFIAVGSCLVMTTIFLVKKHHTAFGYIIFAISALDFIMGNIMCPINTVNVFPETEDMVKSSQEYCSFFHYNLIFLNMLAFDLLILLCVDRMMQKRFKMMKRVIMVNSILSVIFVRVVILNTAVAFNYEENKDIEWSRAQCFAWLEALFPAFEFQMFLVCSLEIEMAVAFALCIMISTECGKTRQTDVASTRKNKSKTRVMWCFVLLYFVLWIPAIVLWLVFEVVVPERHVSTLYPTWVVTDIAGMITNVYCGAHAPLLALMDEDFRRAFQFLMTNCPCNWEDLPKWLALRDRGHRAFSADVIIRENREKERLRRLAARKRVKSETPKPTPTPKPSERESLKPVKPVSYMEESRPPTPPPRTPSPPPRKISSVDMSTKSSSPVDGPIYVQSRWENESPKKSIKSEKPSTMSTVSSVVSSVRSMFSRDTPEEKPVKRPSNKSGKSWRDTPIYDPKNHVYTLHY